MAAAHTVQHSQTIRKSGVLVLSGYGIRVQVNAGHLLANDGIADERRTIRLPRVGHGLRRLVIIGSDGFVSLEALRWLADQDAAFVMLDRDGSVLAATGPVCHSDARLRRAQALASGNGVALEISKELIRQKLAAQEQVAREKLKDSLAANLIAENATAVGKAQMISALRLSESRAAHVYWSAWRNVPVTFPRRDLSRIPEHWQRFGARISPLTGSPRLAANPLNAMLNYLYAILESEACLAAAALGLDPGIGIMHVDTDSRDSLACDLMEPIRPLVDAYVLDWISREPVRREWFCEQRDGNCRLKSSFAAQLTETAPTWGRAVGPIAEWITNELWSTTKKPTRLRLPATRLTQSRRREAKGVAASLPANKPPKPIRVCHGCGASVKRDRDYCAACGLVLSTERMPEVARIGRVVAHSHRAQASRTETQRRNAIAQYAWRESDQPGWLTEEFYLKEIQPGLSGVRLSALALALNVCESYASDIRAGRRRPHPRHWQILAQLVGSGPERDAKVR